MTDVTPQSNDLAVLAQHLDDIELTGLSGQDAVSFVVGACAQARGWLAEALKRGDIPVMTQTRCQAEAIRAYVAQSKIGSEAEMAASEIVRRAERSIALAIEHGREAGTIETAADAKARASRDAHESAGHDTNRSYRGVKKTTVRELVKDPNQLSGNASQPGWRALAQDVSDENFEEAVETAKAEKNLSRANVVRKIKGIPPKAKRDEWHKGRPHLKAKRVVEQTIIGLDGLASGLRLMEETGLSLTDVEPEDWWADSLDEAMLKLRKFQRMVRGMYQ